MNEAKLKQTLKLNKIMKKSEFSQEQLEILNAKINDLDLNSNELTEKLDELLDQKNIFTKNLMTI